MPPFPIAALCSVLFVWTCYGLAGVLMSAGKGPAGMFLWALLMHVLALASVVGLWRLNRWAVYLYLAGYAAGVAAAFTVGTPYQLVGWDLVFMGAVPAVYLAAVLPYWKRLD